MKVQLLLYKIVAFWYGTFVKYCDCYILLFSENHFQLFDFIETLFLRLRGDQLIRTIKDKFSLYH